MSPTTPGHLGLAQAAALLAVGAAAASLVAGLGTYLLVRFTQPGRQLSPRARNRPPAGVPGR